MTATIAYQVKRRRGHRDFRAQFIPASVIEHRVAAHLQFADALQQSVREA